MARLVQFGCGVSGPQYSRVMLTVIPMGDLRRILSLRVKIARKRMRVRENERESTMGRGGSNDTWIENQVRLKALL